MSQRVSGLDGLRAISFLLVLSAHWEPSAAFANLAEWGRHGLIVFFVISGFLITRILISLRDEAELSDDRSSIGAMIVFYTRRAFRIFPVYYVALAFVLAVDLVTTTSQDWIWHATFLNNLSGALIHGNIGVYGATSPWWSLAVEEQFYLLWAPIVIFLPRRMLAAFVAIALAGGIGFRLYAWSSGLPAAISFTVTIGNIDSLAAGAAVALITSRHNRLSEFSRIAAMALIATGTFWFAFLIYLRTGLGIQTFRQTIYNMVWSDPICYVIAAPLIFLLATGRARFVGKLLDMPPLAFVGQRSYCGYVIHQVVAYYLALRFLPKFGIKLQLHGTLEFIVFSAVTLTIAALSYRYFETPILRMRDTLNLSKQRAPAAAFRASIVP